MKIFSADQIRKWDIYTTTHEPISTIDLMERAATACFKWLIGKNMGLLHFRIYCGKGNNGGDGLALARLLIQHKCRVTVCILEFGNIGTPDFQANLEKLHQVSTDIHFLQSPDFFTSIELTDIIIDALFGTGLNKPLEGISAALVNHINSLDATVISIDLPSGLATDRTCARDTIIKATHTLSFEKYKLAFLLPENRAFCGEVHILHIGLHPDFETKEESVFEMSEKAQVLKMYRPRDKFAHKGNFGHAAIFAGSYGMMGAALLSARGCLRGGAGKLTCFIPACGYDIIQAGIPEAMCRVWGDKFIFPQKEERIDSNVPGLSNYDAVGIGPGMGQYPSHANLLKDIFNTFKKPVVIDADALNVLSMRKELLEFIPTHSILTPHPKEFERLFGKVSNEFDRLQLLLQQSARYNIYIILKGHFSFISTPDGKGFFNSTGNAGMAKGGCGDVLTGLLTSLLSQGYTSLQACLLGTYIHGLSGDLAAEEFSQEAMLASDLCNNIGQAFKLFCI